MSSVYHNTPGVVHSLIIYSYGGCRGQEIVPRAMLFGSQESLPPTVREGKGKLCFFRLRFLIEAEIDLGKRDRGAERAPDPPVVSRSARLWTFVAGRRSRWA